MFVVDSCKRTADFNFSAVRVRKTQWGKCGLEPTVWLSMEKEMKIIFLEGGFFSSTGEFRKCAAHVACMKEKKNS